MTRPNRSRALMAALLCSALGLPHLAHARSSARRGRKARVVGKANLNTATRKQLILLPRVGKHSAQAILAYRAQHRFQTIREIIRVKGIGKLSFLRLKPHLTVRGPNTIRRLKAARRTRRIRKGRSRRGHRVGHRRAHRSQRSHARRQSHRFHNAPSHTNRARTHRLARPVRKGAPRSNRQGR